MNWVKASERLPAQNGEYQVADESRTVKATLIFQNGVWRAPPPHQDWIIYHTGYWLDRSVVELDASRVMPPVAPESSDRSPPALDGRRVTREA